MNIDNIPIMLYVMEYVNEISPEANLPEIKFAIAGNNHENRNPETDHLMTFVQPFMCNPKIVQTTNYMNGDLNDFHDYVPSFVELMTKNAPVSGNDSADFRKPMETPAICKQAITGEKQNVTLRQFLLDATILSPGEDILKVTEIEAIDNEADVDSDVDSDDEL